MSNYFCEICEKGFASGNHKFFHSKVKCDFCSKEFRKDYLKKHMNTCNSMKQDFNIKQEFNCDFCNKTFEEMKNKRMVLSDYYIKDLESEKHGEYKLKLLLHLNGYNFWINYYIILITNLLSSFLNVSLQLRHIFITIILKTNYLSSLFMSLYSYATFLEQ